ncbi:MAG: DNA adenine methylase [Candidatus Eisenbacteria bacterium]|uniref:site-specific DNA-methyltransferase (adenine-specific) n=1 Tax=Eiseniibacteriota bacterium TaxID=2212470 RepID=A0A933SB88_UNCEI|nr:DNA adenine methylase [Candidatus Eisenbacteria bacterium]
MIKYLGSKRLLVPWIVETVGRCDGARRVLDLFSGTARVGRALKSAGHIVHANDHNAYAHTLAACHVGADARLWRARAERLIAELDALPGAPGWFTETYCVRSRYLQPVNGARVDAIRDRIAALSLEPALEAIALTSLMEAADRVDSTVGLQMAYLKQWAARSHQPLHLRVPELIEGEGAASCLDAVEAAGRFEADLAYLDPPYNQHSYLGNYHVWESLVRWDRPEVYGVAMKRTDVRERGSDFNRRARILPALAAVLERLRARWLVVSFSDEGYVTLDELRALLGRHGEVREASVAHPRHIGHKIGVYDLAGRRVGEPGPARNREHLFVVETGLVPASAKPAKPAKPAASRTSAVRGKSPNGAAGRGRKFTTAT